MADVIVAPEAPAPAPKNGPRKADKWMWALGGGGVSAVIGIVLQMNGLYFTRAEGVNVKEDLRTLSGKVDGNKNDVVNAVNTLRLDMNKNFADFMLQHTRDQSVQFRLDEKQNLEISELRLLMKTKPTKEN